MRSMTGFGRASAVIDDFHFTIEAKSVNHRFLEARYRLPVSLSFLEIPMNEHLRKRFERGSFEIVLRSRLCGKQGAVQGLSRFVVDELALDSLHLALDRISKRLKHPLPVTADALIHTGRVLVAVEDEKDQGELWKDLESVYEKALSALLKMRDREGKRIIDILERDVTGIERILQEIKGQLDEQPRAIFERLKARVQKWNLENLDGQRLDGGRLELEFALLADKAEVSEEWDRAFAHIHEFRATMVKKGGVGRRLDFLLQELGREINTLGAKAVITPVSHSVVEIKHGIEKLREQVQNVE